MMTHKIVKDETHQLTYITLSNEHHTATFVDFGARIHKWMTPDKHGVLDNIVLTPDTSEDILKDKAQFGAFVGPVAGRIKQAEWDGIALEKNFGEHNLHSGNNGWWNQLWEYTIIEGNDSISVSFSLKDTLNPLPGPIHVTTTYELTRDAIIMSTSCLSEKDTIVNPTNHVYFNLSGNSQRGITSHTLYINADNMLEATDEIIPTGQVLPVAGTGYDFRQPTSLAKALDALGGKGIDDTFVFNNEKPQIILSEEESGRQLEISSTRQAVVVFSTTGFSPDIHVNKQPMSSQLGIALETQEQPDMVNHPEWGSIDLAKGVTKTYQTTYRVGLLS